MDEGADTGIVANVRHHDQDDGDKVVEAHLPVVLAALLHVDHVDLVEPPSKLAQIVELCEPWERVVRVGTPQLLGRSPVRDAVEDDLDELARNGFGSFFI